jgi:hypothetical protein
MSGMKDVPLYTRGITYRFSANPANAALTEASNASPKCRLSRASTITRHRQAYFSNALPEKYILSKLDSTTGSLVASRAQLCGCLTSWKIPAEGWAVVIDRVLLRRRVGRGQPRAGCAYSSYVFLPLLYPRSRIGTSCHPTPESKCSACIEAVMNALPWVNGNAMFRKPESPRIWASTEDSVGVRATLTVLVPGRKGKVCLMPSGLI